ncbi:hypothetical protein KI387_009163 [Taxus chinensis]|uniref:Uncharacterized protein n=1 Tax=Taxus chinensis TaxID=29808 RepID=A0AA38CY27_TAXCH|nr:hypothetical protein KI387_009163 [Taxus chinensis]
MTNSNNKWKGKFLPCGGFLDNLRQKATQLIWRPPGPHLEAVKWKFKTVLLLFKYTPLPQHHNSLDGHRLLVPNVFIRVSTKSCCKILRAKNQKFVEYQADRFSAGFRIRPTAAIEEGFSIIYRGFHKGGYGPDPRRILQDTWRIRTDVSATYPGVSCADPGRIRIVSFAYPYPRRLRQDSKHLISWKLVVQVNMTMKPSFESLAKSPVDFTTSFRTGCRTVVGTGDGALSDSTVQNFYTFYFFIEILKRLQREAFADLMKMRGKLEMLEKQFTHYLSTTRGSSIRGAKTQLKGEVQVGGAFLIMQNGSSHEFHSLVEQARMKTGTEVKFTFETFFRERDLLVTECIAGQGCISDGDVLGGMLTLGKILYSANINDYLSLSVVPLGAKGKDTTTILNPLQDQALTGFFASGPDLFQYCQGSALGVTIKGPNVACSLGKYLSGWGGHSSSSLHGFSDAEVSPLCSSTLGQVLFQPSEGIKFACSGLHRYWPSPPLPSSRILQWSEIGPLIFSNIPLKYSESLGSSSNTSFTQHSGSSVDSFSKGISTQSVAFSVDAEFSEGMRIGGWLQMERLGWMQEPGGRSLQWALGLSEFSEDGLGWGFSIGQSRQDPFGMHRSKEMHCDPGKLPHIQLEAFLKIDCGKGFTLQPGLLYLTNRNAQIPALMLRSTWSL